MLFRFLGIGEKKQTSRKLIWISWRITWLWTKLNRISSTSFLQIFFSGEKLDLTNRKTLKSLNEMLSVLKQNQGFRFQERKCGCRLSEINKTMIKFGIEFWKTSRKAFWEALIRWLLANLLRRLYNRFSLFYAFISNRIFEELKFFGTNFWNSLDSNLYFV